MYVHIFNHLYLKIKNGKRYKNAPACSSSIPLDNKSQKKPFLCTAIGPAECFAIKDFPKHSSALPLQNQIKQVRIIKKENSVANYL